MTATVIAGLGAACAHGPAAAPPACKDKEPLRVLIEASPRLNPDEAGHALSTVVRIYQLKGTAKLQDAGFEDLLDHDKDALGPDLLAVDELTVNPGDKIEPPLVRNPDATHVVVVALFRQPAGTFWRLVRTLLPADPDFCNKAGGKGTLLHFHLEDNHVETR